MKINLAVCQLGFSVSGTTIVRDMREVLCRKLIPMFILPTYQNDSLFTILL